LIASGLHLPFSGNFPEGKQMDSCVNHQHCCCKLLSLLAAIGIGFAAVVFVIARWKKISVFLEPLIKEK